MSLPLAARRLAPMLLGASLFYPSLEAEARCDRSCPASEKDPRGCCPEKAKAAPKPKPKPKRRRPRRLDLGSLPAPKRVSAPEGMVGVGAGPFWMGCNAQVDSECDSDEKPGKVVRLGAFAIDRTEVTVEAYAACVRRGPCTEPDSGGSYDNWGKSGRSRHPVNSVDWGQAQTYCAWKGKRLPTEAEWEKAARGTDGRKYPWGNAKAWCRYAVLDDGKTTDTAGSETDGCGRDSTWPVGSKPSGASPYGALDMAGNVREWTSDWYSQNETHVSRGGYWLNDARNARASYRNWDVPSDRLDNLGLRCAQSL